MPDWKASSSPGFFPRAPGDDYDPSAIGLAFSGGGYRATLFHAGAVIRLGELGFLPKIARISSVSGGSITTGILAMVWKDLVFDADGVADPQVMHRVFTRKILDATAQSIDVRVGFKGLLPGHSAGNVLADTYDKKIFGGMKIKDIPAAPKFVFNATNLQTGGLFRFTRDKLWDWRGVESTTRTIRLAQAVAASSAFPPVLAPVRLSLKGEEVKLPAGARFTDPGLLEEPILVDGGVYDNIGLETLWKRCGVVLAGYAGHNAEADVSNFSFDLMLPVVYTFLAASIDWRERVLVGLFRNKLADGLAERVGAYWTAGTDIAAYGAAGGWAPDAATLIRARDLPTRLDAFKPEDQKAALAAGYAHADRAIRGYLWPDAPPPAGPPPM